MSCFQLRQFAEPHDVLIAVSGDDAAANEILELAESEEQLTPRLVIEPGRRSTVKTRYIAEGQQLLRADDETTAPILSPFNRSPHQRQPINVVKAGEL